jgi:hypothetical protein
MSDLSPFSGVKRKLDFGAVRAETGPSESVATLDRGPRLEDHVTLSELGRIDEAF